MGDGGAAAASADAAASAAAAIAGTAATGPAGPVAPAAAGNARPRCSGAGVGGTAPRRLDVLAPSSPTPPPPPPPPGCSRAVSRAHVGCAPGCAQPGAFAGALVVAGGARDYSSPPSIFRLKLRVPASLVACLFLFLGLINCILGCGYKQRSCTFRCFSIEGVVDKIW